MVGVPGVVIVGSAPAPGTTTPCPSDEPGIPVASLKSGLEVQFNVALPELMVHVIVPGELAMYPPNARISNHGFAPALCWSRLTASVVPLSFKPLAASATPFLDCKSPLLPPGLPPPPFPTGPVSAPVSSL